MCEVLDGMTLYAVQHDIQQHLPLKVQKIYHPNEREVVFALWSGEFQGDLLISSENNVPFLGFVNETREMPRTPSGACSKLRKHLEGGVLVSISQLGLDRVICFEFLGRDDLSSPCNYVLVFDAAGPGGGFGLLKDGKVQFHFPENGSRFAAGCDYIAPKSGKIDLLTETDLSEAAKQVCYSQGPGHIQIMSTIEGIGKDLALSMATYLGLNQKDSLTLQDRGMVQACLENLKRCLVSKQFCPRLYIKDSGQPVFSVFPLYHLNCVESFDSVYQGVSAYRDYFLYFQEHERLEREVKRMYKKIRDKVDSRFEAQQEDLKSALEFENYRIWAELIDSSPTVLPAGHEQIEVLDYYQDPPRHVIVRLDPRYSSKENARRYYRRYAKLKRGYQVLNDSLKESEKLLQALDDIEKRLSEENCIEDLLQLREQLTRIGRQAGIPIAQNKKGKKRVSGEKLAAHTGRDFVDIIHGEKGILYIGKNAQGNDYIIRRIKRPGDIWFHVKKRKGAHVLLRPKKGEALDSELLLWAATLAAQRCERGFADKVEIDYTDAANVTKPKGSPPGFVIYKEAKTILVEI